MTKVQPETIKAGSWYPKDLPLPELNQKRSRISHEVPWCTRRHNANDIPPVHACIADAEGSCQLQLMKTAVGHTTYPSCAGRNRSKPKTAFIFACIAPDQSHDAHLPAVPLQDRLGSAPELDSCRQPDSDAGSGPEACLESY